MKPNSFYPSYSSISKFAKGEIEEAVITYFHLDELKVETEAMTRGKELHLKARAEVDAYHMVPKFLTDKSIHLKQPRTEERLYMEIAPHIHFTGIIDCIDETRVMDWKFGKTPSNEWASTMQLPCYGVLARANDYSPDYGLIYRLDPDTQIKGDTSLVFFSTETLAEAEEWIYEWSVKMYNFLLKKNLFNTYNHRRTK